MLWSVIRASAAFAGIALLLIDQRRGVRLTVAANRKACRMRDQVDVADMQFSNGATPGRGSRASSFPHDAPMDFLQLKGTWQLRLSNPDYSAVLTDPMHLASHLKITVESHFDDCRLNLYINTPKQRIFT